MPSKWKTEPEKDLSDTFQLLALRNINRVRNMVMDVLYPYDELTAVIVLLHEELKEELTEEEYADALDIVKLYKLRGDDVLEKVTEYELEEMIDDE